MHIGANKKKILFVLRKSKTQWDNVPPELIKIKSTEVENHRQHNNNIDIFCPYGLLKQYLSLRLKYWSDEEQFFVYRDRSPVKAARASQVLKKMIKACGIEAHHFSVHGLRSGRACDIFKLGVSVETIRKLGRWKSNAVYKYLKM